MLQQLELGPDHVVRFFLGEHGIFLGEHRFVIGIGVIFVRLVVGVGA